MPVKRLTYVECDVDRCALTYGLKADAWGTRQTGLAGGVANAIHSGTSGTWLSAMGSVHRTTGKYHFEVRVAALATNSPPDIEWRIGLCNGILPAAGTAIGSSGYHTVAGRDGGTVIEINGSSLGSWISPTSGQTAIIEVDLDANLLWMATGASGNWNNLAIGSANPVTGIGGIDISSLRYGNVDSETYADNRNFPIYPAISLYNNGDHFELIVENDQTNFIRTASSGFSSWGYNVAANRGGGCSAALGFGSEVSGPSTATFDGTNDYLTRGAGLTAAADSKRLTFSCWVKLAAAGVGNDRMLVSGTTTLAGGTTRVEVKIDDTDDRFRVIMYNAAGTVIFDAVTFIEVTAGSWHSIICSVDLNVSGSARCYIDNEHSNNFHTPDVFTNDTVDFTLADWSVAAISNGTFKLNADLALLWFAPGVYLDFVVQGNRRLFVTADNRPVYLGATGSLPTGTAPLVFFSNPFSTFHTNLGTGGGFTVNGALTQGSASIPNYDLGEATAAFFNGGGENIERNGGLTGAADGKLVTLSFWLLRGDNYSTARVFTGVDGTNSSRFRLDIFTDQLITLEFFNTAGTILCQIASRNKIPVFTWVNILISVDLNSTATRWMYINDVEAMGTVTTYTNATADFTLSDWAVGSMPNGGANPYYGGIAEFWMTFGTAIDFSVEANRRKFITAYRRPVYLGNRGELPTLTSPILYIPFLPSSFGTNFGTGGNFTDNGMEQATFPTGTVKCFNSAGSCQDRDSFLSDPQTIRFSVPADYLPKEIDSYPAIRTVDMTPAIISLGVDLGQRATMKVSQRDFRDNDSGPLFDKYMVERTFVAYEQGTFFGKFRARNIFPRGSNIRLVHGFLGDRRSEMEVRHFTIDSISGPSADGEFIFTAKDVIKFADDERAQAPLLSSGYLLNDLAAGAGSATLSPANIGDDEYPASGYAAIGGSEIIGYTRSGDSLSFGRGFFNTEDQDHKAGDRVQVCLEFDGVSPATIIATLLQFYAGVPEEYINEGDWVDETDTYLGNIYTALIAEPTSVKTLISELVEQAALVIWWDDIDQFIRLQVLKTIATNAATFNDENIMMGSLDITEQPDKKFSEIWTYFAKINPLVAEDQIDNYRSNAILIDTDAELDYGQSIKKIFSRWIPEGGRSVADRLNEVQLGRYRTPPRRFQFDLMVTSPSQYPQLGVGYQIESWALQDTEGARVTIPIQVTRLNPGETVCSVEAKEMQFLSAVLDPTTRDIIIDASSNNINFEAIHNSIYTVAESGDTINIIIQSGVVIGSESTGDPAVDVGSFVTGVTVNVTNNGRIEGRGGAGGSGGSASHGSATAFSGNSGNGGGTALYTRQSINLTNNGSIYGGGGGGGGGSGYWVVSLYAFAGGGGGGGAGINGGSGGAGATAADNSGANGNNGSADNGGSGGAGFKVTGPPAGAAGDGGDGGSPGSNGSSGQTVAGGGSGGSGGSAGNAIDGISFVTGGGGDVQGPTVN